MIMWWRKTGRIVNALDTETGIAITEAIDALPGHTKIWYSGRISHGLCNSIVVRHI